MFRNTEKLDNNTRSLEEDTVKDELGLWSTWIYEEQLEESFLNL